SASGHHTRPEQSDPLCSLRGGWMRPRPAQPRNTKQTTQTKENEMTAAVATAPKAKRVPVPLNGVDTPNLLATIGAVGAQPELAKFQFRASNRWLSGTHNQSTMHGFSGAGGEHNHVMPYEASGDHPAVLCGADAGPTPVEWLLHALASC